jgi:hypothetical protein
MPKQLGKTFSNLQLGRSLQKISKDNGARIIHFAAFRHINVEIAMFPHHSIHEVTYKSLD